MRILFSHFRPFGTALRTDADGREEGRRAVERTPIGRRSDA